MQASSSCAPALRATALGKRFGRRWALAHLDLEVESGESVLIAGPNGSGKTTLLKLIAGLYRPTSGTIELQGLCVFKHRLACRQHLSLVGHSSYLYERMTAVETMRLWASILGRSGGDERLDGLLDEVGLAARRDSRVGTFSAGMKKRLALARSRLEQPSLLLLDEPFAALDVDGQQQVESWIRHGRDEGKTIIVASHQLQQASRLCDRGVLLDQGQAIWRGAAADLPAAFAERA
jgi:heme ABC exporter ATP-binding subunit CcmA